MNTKQLYTRSSALIVTLMALISIMIACNKEFHNPYDRDCPADIWTPSALQTELTEDGVLLSWQMSETHFDGYNLEMNLDDGWEKVNKNLLPYTQTSFKHEISEPGQIISYRLSSVADQNTSNYAETQIELPAIAPTVLTSSVTSITFESAVFSGQIISDGGANIKNAGFCYSVTDNPDMNDQVVSASLNGKYFSCQVESLTPATTYFVRAFATNNEGTTFGSQLSFSTSTEPPLVITNCPTNIESSSVVLEGEVLSAGGGTSLTEQGFCIGTEQEPDIQNSSPQTVATGVGNFSFQLNALDYGQTYYVRAYAINDLGTVGYGEEQRFTTKITQTIWDNLSLPIPKYSGDTPPVLDGAYLAMPYVLGYSYYPDDNYFDHDSVLYRKIGFEKDPNCNTTYNFYNQDLDSKGTEIGECWVDKDLYVFGSGNNFTGYATTSYTNDDGIFWKWAVIISGTITTNGIEDYYYGFYALDKVPDLPNDGYIDKDSYRIFKDGD
ncbi:MAG: hypothetical protein PF436_08030, partial [Prolixibacteraceae bacterium]|nr:hypothetical protein [Prolixibacteraceae bacterium]